MTDDSNRYVANDSRAPQTIEPREIASTIAWEFTAPKYFNFTNPRADSDAEDGYFESAAPRALSTPSERRVRPAERDETLDGKIATDERCAFMRDPENRGMNGDLDRTSPKEIPGRLQSRTPGRTPRRLGAPRRAAANDGSSERKVKTPKTVENTPVRRSPRLLALVTSSMKKEASSAKSPRLDASRGRSSQKRTPKENATRRFTSQSPMKRILKTPKPTAYRVASIAKHERDTQSVLEARRKVTEPIAPTSRLLESTKRPITPVEKFRSRKEKLRAFETGGRTTDYEDLTQIPASTTTTRAVSPKFTRTRMKQKILTTEERELLEIQNTKAAMEREKQKRRTSSYAPPYTTIKSKLAHSLTSARRSKVYPEPPLAVDDVSDAIRRTRSRRTSAPMMERTRSVEKIEQTPPEDARKRKRISITGSVLTEITPFQLSTEQRGAYHKRKFARLQEEEAKRKKSEHRPFKATPVPPEQRAGVSITRQALANLLGRGKN
ncbi:hypothetical protein BE221DRAFT_206523 [Ostreococcus tauri]|uniref:Uncharacterized protein n=1 Tax=Ostreococcus tauri TaxID=70448 RepID=A0A1Y5I7N1_OSTTA|nr:hypothetical protein BE221DRAFT_206523 [Ostreococcus tauri]